MWEENVILCDAQWLDSVVFNLIVNFERMLERPIPKADLTKWVDYLSLDGGLRPGNNKVQVLLVHDEDKRRFQNCVPENFEDDLDGKAFSDNLGEFQFASLPVQSRLTSRQELFMESAATLLQTKEVKRIMFVPDMDLYGEAVGKLIHEVKDKDALLFTPEPKPLLRCPQEILTYSLVATLGIRSEELPH